ncbi:Tyrosine recombinase XerC [subsurface metagenome]
MVRNPPKLNKTSQQLAIRRADTVSADYVYHLDLEQVKLLAEAAGTSRHGERDKLLVLLLFDGCLRCSEALNVRPSDLEPGWVVKIPKGKGDKYSLVAISSSLAAQLQAHAYRHQLAPDAKFFPISRPRAFQIISEAFDKASIPRPSRAKDKVGTVHILRHSGAIERLKRTGNPKAVQDQLRHKSALMTLRYMKTLSHDESLKIQQEVDFQW